MSEQIKINTALQLDPELTNIQPFKAYEGLTVTNEQEAAMASNHLVAVKGRIKDIKKQKDKVEKPLKEALNNFRDMANQVLRPLETVEKILKSKIGNFIKGNQEKKEKEEQKFREEEAAKRRQLAAEQQKLAMAIGDDKAAEAAIKNQAIAERLETAPIVVRQTQRVDKGTVAHRWVYEWTVVDLSKVPLEYLTIDTKKLNEIKRNYAKEPIDIPGVEFNKEVNLSTRSN